MPVFRGTFFLKKVKLSGSYFEYVLNYRYLLKHAEVWALFWENVAKISKKNKGYAKVV